MWDGTNRVNRRELLTAGLAAGAGALLLGTTTRIPTAAAADPTGEGSTGDGHGTDAEAAPTALPAAVAGARMLGIFGTAFYTMGYDTTHQASVLYVSGKGAAAGGDGLRLFARIPVEPGSRIVQLDYYGYRDTSGQQLWWLSRRDPTTFQVSDLTSDTVTGSGAISIARTVNELVLPGYDYSVGATSGLGATGEPFVRGAVIQYLPAAGDFFPIAPRRVYDSRVSGGAITGDEERTLTLAVELGTSDQVIPAAATAAAINLTLDQTSPVGWLSVRPAGTAWDGTSTINWSTSGTILANGTTSRLGGDREVTVRCRPGSSTHFLIDVLGYYL